eukprot:333107_1
MHRHAARLKNKKARLNKRKLNAYTQIKLQEIDFFEIDDDGDGKLDAKELAKACNITEEEAKEAIQQYDENSDGLLDKKEFETLKQDILAQKQEQNDKNNTNGYTETDNKSHEKEFETNGWHETDEKEDEKASVLDNNYDDGIITHDLKTQETNGYENKPQKVSSLNNIDIYDRIEQHIDNHIDDNINKDINDHINVHINDHIDDKSDDEYETKYDQPNVAPNDTNQFDMKKRSWICCGIEAGLDDDNNSSQKLEDMKQHLDYALEQLKHTKIGEFKHEIKKYFQQHKIYGDQFE